MRIVVAALLVGALCGLTGVAAQEKKEPTELADGKYESPRGFKIQFPPKTKIHPEATGKSKDNEMRGVKADFGEGKGCAIIYLDIKDFKSENLKELAAGVVKAVGKNDVDKIEPGMEGKFGKDELPGREFVVHLKDKRKLKARLLVHESRIYTLMITDLGDGKLEGATKVLDTFELKR